MKKATPKKTTLKQALDEKRAAFTAKAPAETVTVYDRGVKELAESGIVERALKTGQPAPDFELQDATGKPVRLSTLLKDGPVVLTFYRGAWCPYCNIQLRYLQRELPAFKAAGATLVAVSPQKPDKSLDTVQKNELEFVVVSDVKHAVADSYGLLYTLSDEVLAKFKGRIDVAGHNQDGTNRLPLTATYVIGRDGRVAWDFVSADYRERAEPSEIIKALNSL